MAQDKKAPEIEEADFITLEFDDGIEVEIGRASCRERV